MRLRLVECVAVLAIVDPGDHVARDNVLIICDRDCRDVTRHLRSDAELARGNEGVVGRLEVPSIVPIKVARRPDNHQAEEAEGKRDPMPPSLTGRIVWLGAVNAGPSLTTLGKRCLSGDPVTVAIKIFSVPVIDHQRHGRPP